MITPHRNAASFPKKLLYIVGGEQIIGASLSEPHIDELNVRNLYIYYGGGGTSVTRAPPYTLYAVRDIFRRPHEETSALSGTTCTIIAESAK